MGVLAAIAVPNLFRAVEKSHVTEALLHAGNIKSSLDPIIMQAAGTICPGGSILPDLLDIVDQVGPKQPQYFLSGSAAAAANGNPSANAVSCFGDSLVIFIDRNRLQAGNDPCLTAPTSSQCQWSACGLTNQANSNSGIVLCRDDTGKWEIAYSGWYK